MPTLYGIYGRVDDAAFHECYFHAKRLTDHIASIQIEQNPLFEIDWTEFLGKKKKEFGGVAFDHRENYIIIKNDEEYIGNIDNLKQQFTAEEINEFDGECKEPNFKVIANQEYLSKISQAGHQLCYMDIKIEGEGTHRVEIELFNDIVPKTANNFRCLCTGEKGENEDGLRLGYRNSVFHRVVQGGWIQAGDIVSGSGDGGWSIYGETFPDESFAVKFSQEGIVAMANDGAHTNSSQFFISLAPLPWLNHHAVAFGRVARGMTTVRKMAGLPLENERPTQECLIIGCGQINL